MHPDSRDCRLPFYYPLKMLFLLYLALPQTAGASYLYTTHVQPFFAAHESQIDSALVQLKTYVYNYLQRMIRSAWQHVTMSMGPGSSEAPRADALDEGGLTGDAAINMGAPPSLSDPVSGPAQLVQTFWRSYGPSVIAAGAGFLRQAQDQSHQSAQAALNTPPIGHSRMNSSQSMNERRRQLEAELAALSSEPAKPFDLSSPPVPMPSANNPSRSSSATSVRERTASGAGKSTFEEVEVPSDMESEGLVSPTSDRPAAAKRTSWFGWGGPPAQGYERVKTD